MADTSLGCTVSSATTFCTDSDSISMSVGDLFTLRVTYNSGSSGADDTFLTTLICQ